MIRTSGTRVASIEETLALWAASLREIKKRIRPLFKQDRVAANAGLFLEGLLGDEQRKTGWMRADAAGDPGPWRQQAILGRSDWDADALLDIVRDYAIEHLADDPRPIVLRAIPVARITAMIPPCPADVASAAAAKRRRPRSSSTGARASKRWRMANSSITPQRYSLATSEGIPPANKIRPDPIHLFADWPLARHGNTCGSLVRLRRWAAERRVNVAGRRWTARPARCAKVPRNRARWAD